MFEKGLLQFPTFYNIHRFYVKVSKEWYLNNWELYSELHLIFMLLACVYAAIIDLQPSF